MSRFRLSAPLVALALVATATVARAQDVASPVSPASVSARAVSETGVRVAGEPASPLRPAPVAATRAAGSTDLVEADAAFRDARAREAGHEIMRQGTAHNGKVYGIVGAATFLAGAVIGGDAGTIIMIGGAGLGLYGLYLYMR